MRIDNLSAVVAALESGKRPKGGVSSETGTIPSLGGEHLNNDGGFRLDNLKYIGEDFFVTLKKGAVRKRDILIVKDGATTGKVSFVNDDFPFEKAAINEHLFALTIDTSKAEPGYVFSFLKSPQGQKEILKDFRGAAIGGISRGFIDLAKIPLPPLDDQKRIAHLLGKVEGLIARRKQHLQQLDDLLKSVFLEMFGDPVQMKHQHHFPLSAFIEFLTSGSRGWAKYYSDSGSVFIRINNVKDANLKLDDIVYVKAPDSAEANRTRVKPRDLLMSITADLGRTAVVPKELEGAYINQHLALIRISPGADLDPLFLAWYFALPYGNSFIQRKNREGVKAGLNYDDIRGLQVVKPDIALQKQFAAIVEKVEGLKSRYQRSLTDLENLYGALSQNAFKGELDLSRVKLPVNEVIEELHVEKHKIGIAS